MKNNNVIDYDFKKVKNDVLKPNRADDPLLDYEEYLLELQFELNDVPNLIENVDRFIHGF